MTGEGGFEGLALSVRKKIGLSRPPINPIVALGAYQLSLPFEPLEDILAAAGLSEEQIGKVDAMLDLKEQCVYVREGMHDRKKNWGYLHELAHRIIPSHRDLLYRCSILRLPPTLQKRFEREADEFAAEVFFFGRDFIDNAMSLPFGLAAPARLANERYDVSLHAAFIRYVRQNPEKCRLLVFSPTKNEESGMFDVELKYYVNSDSMNGHIPPRQVLPSGSSIGRLYNSGQLASVVEHAFTIGGPNPQVYDANSFTNGFNIFTLIWNPRKATGQD